MIRRYNKMNTKLGILFILGLFFISIFMLGNNNGYYLLIYNSDYVTDTDVELINKYGNTLGGNFKIIDAKGINDATSIYSALKNSYYNISENIKGIQIFGTKNEVPAFNVEYAIDFDGKTDTAYSNFVSDFFYSNFDSEPRYLKNMCPINKMIDYNVGLRPKWVVARLPLLKGQISSFINKYFDYKEKIRLFNVPIISFSNPILPNIPVIDDMGYFISEKIDKKYGYINSDNYILYGLLDGTYKVTGNVKGNFNWENVADENKNGIMHLFINCHGEKDKFIKTVFSSESLSSQKFTSFMDKSNINKILSDNYYTLTAWSCLIAENLDSESIVYDMLRGKCIDAIASTTIISNNGTNNMVSFDESKRNNFYCFYYELFNSLHNGCGRSISFYNAQNVYCDAILNHKYDSYQYQILNLLGYHYLGLI